MSKIFADNSSRPWSVNYRPEITENVMALVDSGFRLISVADHADYKVRIELDGPQKQRAGIAVDFITLQAPDLQSILYIETPSGWRSWVTFVLGNDDGEVVSDWGLPSVPEAELMDKIFSEISDRRMAGGVQ